MSWSNPTQQEAQEAYDAARQRYDSTAEEYIRLTNQQEQYVSQVESAYVTYRDGEKRLTALRQLEFKLQRISRNFSSGDGNIDSNIYLARSYRADLQNGLRGFVACEGMASPTLGRATLSPFVDEDADTSRIKELIRAELTRVQELMNIIDSQIRDFQDQYSDFAANLTSYEEERKELKSIMDSCTLDMEHYRKFL